MVTFQYYVNPKQKRRDGTMNVKIIVTYKRKRKMLATSIYCDTSDITRGGKLKNQAYIDILENIIRGYRKRVALMGLEYGEYSIEYIVKRLTDSDKLDFFVFAEEAMKSYSGETFLGYRSAVRAVENFLGRRVLDFKEMTRDFFVRFEKFLADRHGGLTSGDTIYINKIRTLYRRAQIQFNDENNEVLSSYPLLAYSVPKLQSERKRALPVEKIREIMNLQVNQPRARICRDLFIMSFCLMGMNAADFYTAERIENGRICYNRKKTRGRRADKAYIEVVIDPRIKPLVERYKGKRRAFLFGERYTDKQYHNIIEKHIKNVGKMAGVENLTFYAARHSFATIAYNDCGIDKYIVHSMLNHVPQEMKITDVYIRRTFDKENDANKRVLDLLFQ